MSKVVVIQDSEDDSKQRIYTNFNLIMKKFNYLDDLIKSEEKVLIKPNLVAPFEKATTNIILLECMIHLIKSKKAIPIVAESSGFEFSTEGTMRILGIDDLCVKNQVELINLDYEEFIEIESGNSKVPKYLLPRLIYEVDHIINMPCLKGHSLTKVTFSIKNLFGFLHRDTRRRIHATDLELGISKLSKLIKIDFTLVNGLWNLTNAVYSESFYQGIIIAGDNIYDTDKVCCELFGVNYKSIPHIALEASDNQFEYEQLTAVKILENIQNKKTSYFIKQNKKYKLVYIVDSIFNFFIHKSIIPYCHYYLGVRPHIISGKCTNCKRCEEVCPVNAILGGKISSRKCMKVRCLKCIDMCPHNAIVRRGLHRWK